MKATWVMALILFFASFTTNAQTVSEQNLALVQNFKPEAIWKNFANLSTIPRCSNDEAAVAEMLTKLALQNNLKSFRDSLNNVLVYLPASPGFENRQSVCLQGHIDMVCQAKDGKGSDIFPIRFVKEGDTLKTNGTTLGADNGLGLSAMMTFMSDPTIKHGPMELLFTTGEEIGLIGAKGFDYSRIHSKVIYNIDSEKDAITIGCAGGVVMQTILVPTFTPIKTSRIGYNIQISGFKGGHSGGDINLGRANAIKVMSQLLLDLRKFSLTIGEISGGSAINTIPRECQVRISIPARKNKKFIRVYESLTKKIAAQFPLEQPLFTLTKMPKGILYNRAMDKQSCNQLLSILKKLPNGVLATEEGNKDFVRTSNNVGFVAVTTDTIFIKMLFRSSSNEQLDYVKKVIESICVGQKTDMLFRFAPWEPNFESELVKLASSTYSELFQKAPLVRTTHGGLEAAVFSERLPGTQIISFGPTIHNAHTPNESIEISSVSKFWLLLLALMAK